MMGIYVSREMRRKHEQARIVRTTQFAHKKLRECPHLFLSASQVKSRSKSPSASHLALSWYLSLHQSKASL